MSESEDGPEGVSPTRALRVNQKKPMQNESQGEENLRRWVKAADIEGVVKAPMRNQLLVCLAAGVSNPGGLSEWTDLPP